MMSHANWVSTSGIKKSVKVRIVQATAPLMTAQTTTMDQRRARSRGKRREMMRIIKNN